MKILDVQISQSTEGEVIGGYPVHPIASLFPLMEGKEFDELVEDINLGGQRNPIVIHEGMLLDGRNRLRACLQLDIPPVITQFKPAPNLDPAVWILSQNLYRRSLDEDQRAAIAAQAEAWFTEQGRLRREAQGDIGRQHGEEGGRGHKKPPAMNSSPGVSEPKTRAKDARSTVGQVAANAKVSHHKAAQAVTVKKHAPELLDEVKRGKRKLKDAAKEAQRRKAKPPKKPKSINLEKLLQREVARFERMRDSLPEALREQYSREFIRTLGNL